MSLKEKKSTRALQILSIPYICTVFGSVWYKLALTYLTWLQPGATEVSYSDSFPSCHFSSSLSSKNFHFNIQLFPTLAKSASRNDVGISFSLPSLFETAEGFFLLKVLRYIYIYIPHLRPIFRCYCWVPWNTSCEQCIASWYILPFPCFSSSTHL